MASPLDGQEESKLSDSVYQRILSQFQGEWISRLNVDQMFVLIDGMLPFEACLYYQVLPLFLDGNRLHLGMVSPEDVSASEYVRRIISYLNYSLVCHTISSEALRTALTAYLNYVGNQQTGQRESFSYGHHRHSGRSRVDRRANPTERLTLVVDSPEELYAAETAPLPPKTTGPTPLAANPTVTNPAIASPAAADTAESLTEPGIISIAPSAATPGMAQPASTRSTPVASSKLSALGQPLAILHVEPSDLTSSLDTLATLPPAQMLQELLARVLLGGIGRLYFERYTQHGRVVWSQNGVLQSVLDQISLPALEGLIEQLKQMAGVSHAPIQQPQQTETEYLYNRSCVLLRFRFMLGTHGEEATVQVLRGAALKFYQQQQLGKLEHDAISIAKQLQNKLNEIRVRAYADPSLMDAKLKIVPELAKLLQSLGQQLDDLEGQ